MLFTYFLVVHHNLNFTFSPLDLFQKLRRYDASIYTTTESAMSPFSDIYRSVVEIPQNVASTESEIWAVPGSPKPQVYQLGSPVGATMYQALGQVFGGDVSITAAMLHNASQCGWSMFDPDRLFRRECQSTPDDELTSVVASGRARITFVERVCSTEKGTSTKALLRIGHPFTTRCNIHDLYGDPRAVLHVTHRAKQQNMHAFISHRACHFNYVPIGMSEATNFSRRIN